MRERSGCFKRGCLGCFGVAALVVLVLVVLLVLGRVTGGREGRIELIERAQALPPGASAVLPAAEPGESPTLRSREIEVTEPGRVVLDLSRGEFEIVSGPPGEPIRVEGRYDAGRFRLDVHEESYGETGWVYRVGFDAQGIGLRLSTRSDGAENHLRLVLPRDTPIVLEGHLSLARSRFELGGLWLVAVDLDLGVGEHTVGFSEPLPIPLGRLQLDTSVGELSVERLGHASPREAQISHTVGATRIDLRGAWRRDSTVGVTCGVGECDVSIPDDVNVELRGTAVLFGQTSEPALREPVAGAPTVELSVSATLGEVRVH